MLKRHPLLLNLILTMAIQIGVYLIMVFETQIIEPVLQLIGVRSQGIMAPTEVVRIVIFRITAISAAIIAGILESRVYFWVPSFLLIFIGFIVFYPDAVPMISEIDFPNLPWLAENLGYGTKIYSAACQAVFSFIYQVVPYSVTRILIVRKRRKQDDNNL